MFFLPHDQISCELGGNHSFPWYPLSGPSPSTPKSTPPPTNAPLPPFRTDAPTRLPPPHTTTSLHMQKIPPPPPPPSPSPQFPQTIHGPTTFPLYSHRILSFPLFLLAFLFPPSTFFKGLSSFPESFFSFAISPKTTFFSFLKDLILPGSFLILAKSAFFFFSLCLIHPPPPLREVPHFPRFSGFAILFFYQSCTGFLFPFFSPCFSQSVVILQSSSYRRLRILKLPSPSLPPGSLEAKGKEPQNAFFFGRVPSIRQGIAIFFSAKVLQEKGAPFIFDPFLIRWCGSLPRCIRVLPPPLECSPQFYFFLKVSAGLEETLRLRLPPPVQL